MKLLDILIEPESKHVDWCIDPSDLQRALVKRLTEIEPRDEMGPPAEKKPEQFQLAKELGRMTQH